MDAPTEGAQPLFSVFNGSLRTARILDTHHKIASAVESQTLSEQVTHSIKHLINADSLDIAHLRQAIEQLELSQKHTRNFVDPCMISIPVELRPTASSGVKAQQVFGTPELLEQIILYISPRELLHVVQINKAILQNFHGSPKLYDHLSLRPRPDGFLKSIFEISWGVDFSSCLQVRFEPEYDEVPTGEWGWGGSPMTAHKRANRAKVRLGWRGNTLPTIGSFCRSMLVCQPPAKEMQVAIDCCGLRGPLPSPEFYGDEHSWEAKTVSNALTRDGDASDEETDETGEGLEVEEPKNDVTKTLMLYSKTGITVGDIYGATQSLRYAHRLCPYAHFRLHNERGIVIPSITFDTILTLKHDDPHLVDEVESELQQELDTIQEEYSDQVRSEKVMTVYIKAKLKAHENGWPIPTFEEFKAKHSVDGAMW